MAIGTRGSRTLVVGGRRFRWSASAYRWAWSEFSVTAEDRGMSVRFESDLAAVRVLGPALPGMAPGARTPARVRGPGGGQGIFGPREIARVIAWCLDPSVAKEPLRPADAEPSWWPWRELSATLLCPSRPRRDEVLALAVESLGAPRDDAARAAWSRSTTRPHRRRRQLDRAWELLDPHVDVAALRAHVDDPRCALALAADPDGAVEATLVARELCARRAALGAPTADRVAWALVDEVTSSSEPRPGAWCMASVDASLRASGVAWEEPPRAAEDLVAPRAWAFDDARHAARWALAAQRALRPLTWQGAPEPPGDAPFAELPDLFAPLLRVWSLGYGVGAVGPDGALLVTPPL